MVFDGQYAVINLTMAPMGQPDALGSVVNQRIEFEVGAGKTILGIDNAVEGMSVGEIRQVIVSSSQAFGNHDESLVQSIPIKEFPPTDGLRADKVLIIQTPQGAFQAVVVQADDREAVLDYNHPLAGKDLLCTIELLKVHAHNQGAIEIEEHHHCSCGCERLKESLAAH